MDDPVVRRKTRQQRVVYETVVSTESHPTAEWVYRQVRRQLPRISLGTVYRNLQRLVAEGKLKAWTRGRTTRFDADVTHHDHFVCRECGWMLDLERTSEALAAEKRLKARGHEVQDRVLEFIGLCRDCRQGRNRESENGRR
jgi:Fur family transcriptional regulator, peroxide stress response regulator